MLAGGALWFNAQQSKQSDKENKDNQREEALQAYIESMSELLLEKKLSESKPDDEVRTIARVRTLAVLPRLDQGRKWSVLHFLKESGLINKDLPIIDLDCADFSDADLRGINLLRANLCAADTSQELDLYEGVHLERADLSHAKLDGANFFMAKLQSAKLRWASLEGADFSNADLTGADLRNTKLHDAKLDFLPFQPTNRGLPTTAQELSGALKPHQDR